eukprot:scaffold107248_cov23-Tisochrysis_lutea.AAC.1
MHDRSHIRMCLLACLHIHRGGCTQLKSVRMLTRAQHARTWHTLSSAYACARTPRGLHTAVRTCRHMHACAQASTESEAPAMPLSICTPAPPPLPPPLSALPVAAGTAVAPGPSAGGATAATAGPLGACMWSTGAAAPAAAQYCPDYAAPCAGDGAAAVAAGAGAAARRCCCCCRRRWSAAGWRLHSCCFQKPGAAAA